MRSRRDVALFETGCSDCVGFEEPVEVLADAAAAALISANRWAPLLSGRSLLTV